jgi:HTH-type transcriptional repressor of NAD biosynthesis genes
MHGLILGKFHPPHKGHHFVINAALREVDELSVVVCGYGDQFIPLELRRRWLQEIHPEIIIYTLDKSTFDKENAQEWVNQTVRLLGRLPDVIIGSAEYGEVYAQLAGCDHRLIDPDRKQFPISATQILANPTAHLDAMEPVVREYFLRPDFSPTA